MKPTVKDIHESNGTTIMQRAAKLNIPVINHPMAAPIDLIGLPTVNGDHVNLSGDCKEQPK